jgi:aminoglycoside 3-N-acetyltransferase
VTILQSLSGAALRHLPRGRVLALRTSYLGLRERLSPLLKTMHGGFTADDLRAHLEIRVGGFEVLMVHSSLNFMHPYFEGGPSELLEMLVQFVGRNRTLVMPAFYLGDPELNNAVEHYRRSPRFDVRRAPSQMGILTELFRRRAEVKVSLHPTHRTAALGPLAEAITAGHFAAGTTFGQGTPFDVMAAHDTAIIGIGKTYEVLTQVHHVEDLLGDAFPVPRRVNPVEVTVIDSTKTSRVYSLRTSVFDRPRRMPKLRPLMSQSRLQEWKFHSVPMFHTRAAWVTEDLLAAAKRGQTIYELTDGRALGAGRKRENDQ